MPVASPGLDAKDRLLAGRFLRSMNLSAVLSAFVCIGLSVPMALSAEADAPRPLLAGEPTREDIGRAKSLLESWENREPEKQPRVMRIIYWVPADRDPQPAYVERLTRVMKHIQAFYLREMTAWGFPGRTIRLDLDERGLLKICVAKGTLKSADCKKGDQKLGPIIRKDALAALKKEGINGNDETMVIFCNLTEWDPSKRTLSHHGPYYASGSSKNGTAWQVDSALLDPASLGVKDQHIDDGEYGHISLGKYNSIFVGGVCHELGHALGLPHCRECKACRDARGTALMGSGNRSYGDELRGEGKGTFLTLGHALKLAAHPQFSGSVKQMKAGLSASVRILTLVPDGDGLNVTGMVSANLPVHAVLGYADPEGGQDYDSAISAAVPRADGSFALHLPKIDKRNRSVKLSFVAVGVNGAATAGVWSEEALTLPARLDGHSAYQVEAAVERLAVEQNLKAWKTGTLAKTDFDRLPAKIRQAFERLKLSDSASAKPLPGAVSPDVSAVPLSQVRPVSAKTGWGGVHYDRTPEGNPLMGPDGVFGSGLFAHAASEYIYDLDGKWNTLSGVCAVVENGYGTVEGRVTLDGKEIWKSGPIEAGQSRAFNLPVKGGKQLKLEIRGVNGISGAWGAWGDVLLKRDGV